MAYNPWAEDDGGDEDKDNPKVIEQRNAKVANAMIIDARPNMFEVNCNGDIPFANCLRACAHTLKNQVICEDTDFVGIYFAGAEHKSEESTFDNVYIFKELSAPTASLIRQIDTVLADLPALQAKLGALPPDARLPLAHAIWSVNLDVAKKKLKETDTVSLWMFTNDDDPFRGDAAAERQCVQRARDGAEQGHEYVLWCMNRQQGVEFDARKFYGKIIPVDEDEDEAVFSAGDGDFSRLLEHVRRKAFKKRVLGTFPLTLGPGLEVAVSMYARIMPLTIPTPVKLVAATNAPLVCKTRWFCEETTEFLLDHQIKHFVPYGGHDVFVSKEEMKAVKDASPSGASGITLVGFRPRAQLKDHHNLRTSYFLYPNEKEVQGATTAFAAIHHKMLELDRFGVGLLSVAKRAPKLVALVAQSEERDEDGFQLAPAGINVIPLPFADDFRDIPAPPVGDVDSDALVHAEALVEKLRLPEFQSVNFENPKVQRHYAGVQSLALLEDADEDTFPEDATLPDVVGMKKRALAEIDALAAAVGYDPNVGLVGAKPAPRKRAAGGGGGGAKKATKKEPSAPLSLNEIERLAASAGLKKKTVVDLKAMLGVLGKSTTGKKADLIARIESHFE